MKEDASTIRCVLFSYQEAKIGALLTMRKREQKVSQVRTKGSESAKRRKPYSQKAQKAELLALLFECAGFASLRPRQGYTPPTF